MTVRLTPGPYYVRLREPLERGGRYTISTGKPRTPHRPGTEIAFLVGHNRADAELLAASWELREALQGLYGLLQLFAARSDAPQAVREFSSHWRARDARAALAKAGLS